MVEAAARASAEGLPDLAEEACSAIEQGTWRHECHFRAGEEAGRQAHWTPAVAHCARSGDFSEYCAIHLAFQMPRDPLLDPADPEALAARAREFALAVDAGMVGADPEWADRARAKLRTGFWYDAYVGRGHASPLAARGASKASAPAARLAWATELMRLLEAQGAVWDPVAAAEEVWTGARPAPSGVALDTLPPGRHRSWVSVWEDREASTLTTFGGGRRLVASDGQTDRAIAAVEGLYYLPDVPIERFVSLVDHPIAEVRHTAARLVRVTPSSTFDHKQVLTGWLTHADPVVAGHARDGLRFKEYRRARGGKRPR